MTLEHVCWRTTCPAKYQMPTFEKLPKIVLAIRQFFIWTSLIITYSFKKMSVCFMWTSLIITITHSFSYRHCKMKAGKNWKHEFFFLKGGYYFPWYNGQDVLKVTPWSTTRMLKLFLYAIEKTNAGNAKPMSVLPFVKATKKCCTWIRTALKAATISTQMLHTY